MTEELTFEELACESGAIDGYKDFVGAVAGEMYLAGDHFLANAGFACNDNGTTPRCDCSDHFDDRIERSAASNKSLAPSCGIQ